MEADVINLSDNEIVTLTQIMAVNGDVPTSASGWRSNGEYVGGVHRLNGVLGEVATSGDTAYVCVSAVTSVRLPNTHPDYVPSPGTAWVSVPTPDRIEWRYVPPVYHSREGWRIRKPSVARGA